MSTQTAAVVNNNLSNGFSILKKKKRTSDTVLRVLIIVCALIAVALIAGIIIYVVIRGVPVLLSNPNFLIGQRSFLQGTYGILPNIINTLYIIVITLIIATPIGVGSAIFLNEYAKPGKLVKIIEFTTETLSGIPSILFGLFGMVFFGNVLGMGTSILCGCLTLTLMILPTITRTAQEALKTVPLSYRSGALGIGATKWYMIRTVILPSSIGGIATGVILAIGRIVGESAALIFTAGSGSNMVTDFLGHPMQSGATLTVEMYLRYTANNDSDNAFGIALVLIVLVLIINICAGLVRNRFAKKTSTEG